MSWPAHCVEVRDWVSLGRQGNRDDRTLSRIEVAVPPVIAGLTSDLSGEVAQVHEAALIAVARLEAGFGQHLAPLADFLLRSESVASSKIERIDAGWHA
ncbi:MAG: Fic family protein, partial [Actinomycetia bacterium]|nr:Fic family protein [Actinomycetes bacterium]